MALVSRRVAALGIAYQTDAAIDQGVDIVGTFLGLLAPAHHLSPGGHRASSNPAAATYIVAAFPTGADFAMRTTCGSHAGAKLVSSGVWRSSGGD